MALPIVLGGAAAVSALYGTKKGYDAYSDTKKAKELQEAAEKTVENAEESLDSEREETKDRLEALGRLKLEVWDEQVGKFIAGFEKLKNVELKGDVVREDWTFDGVSDEELGEMKQISVNAGELAGGGASALGSGALTGIAAYGGAQSMACASTGTAISSLSGAAASNATLAWFGGGSLASGGFGMTVGAAILGSIVAGPILAVGGIVSSSKAEEKLEKAKTNHKEAQAAAEKMKTAETILGGIQDVVGSYEETIRKVRRRFDDVIDDLESVIDESGTNYADFSDSERRTVHESVMYVQVTKSLLTTPILDEDGGLSPECHAPLELAEDELME